MADDRDRLNADARRLRAQVDELIAERAALPPARRKALMAQDQPGFFAVETRLAVIDTELLDAETELAQRELALAWLDAEAAHADEQALQRRTAEAGEAAQQAEEAAGRVRFPAAEADKLRGRADELHRARHRTEVELQEAVTATNLALQRVDQLEERIEAMTGRRPRPGDGLRAQPPAVGRNVTVQGPRPGESAFVAAGDRPPRWAARHITRDDVWEPAEEPDPTGVRLIVGDGPARL